MAMNFWQAQRKAKSRTTLFVSVFVFLTLFMAALSELALRFYAGENYNPPLPYLAIVFIAITCLTAGYQYFSFSLYGGRYVAESLGAQEVTQATRDPYEKQLYNIVEEMSLAASLPLPSIYVLDSKQINAFAAGLVPGKAAVAITRGSLERLSRDEIQGVIAHEMGHIYNGDSKVSLRLAAMVMGLIVLFYLGLRILEGGVFFGGGRSRKNEGGGQVILLAGLILVIAGAITWFGGAILKSLVSREREYLADASAVQFTRNPNGIAGALRKIAKDQYNDMPKSGIAYTHLYFNHHSTWDLLFASHPPIEKRIEAIEGGRYTETETQKM